MLFDDTYKTILNPVEAVFRDRGSKFLAFAYPVRTEEETKILLADLKKLHPKAVHFCRALRLGQDRSVFKVSDDGEPAGTAGRPMLNVLWSAELTNIFVVVVRYFGGTLLGVPGLINAYKTATQEALNAAELITKTLNDVYEVHFEYAQMNEIMRVIKDLDLNVLKQDFNLSCSLTFEVRKAQLNEMEARFTNLEGIELKYLHAL